jgi:YD repeat-containing protein
MCKLLSVTYADGGQTTHSYTTTSRTDSTLISAGNSISQITSTDGYGRVIQTRLTSDPDCSAGDKTDTTYDALGRVSTVSNPYCSTSDSTYGLTTYNYDALGRVTRVTNPDNSTALTTYTGAATQVQDEGNGTQRVSRISQSDALDRLISVCEVATGPFVGAGGSSSSSLIGSGGTPVACGQSIAGTGFLTTYQYDVLDNLIQVNQSGIGARTYAYDSLSRLTSASNSESGTISYTYDANGNAMTKIAPAPNQTATATVTTTYQYDQLNRLTQKSYSDGTTPTVTFIYDSISGVTITNGIGRLVRGSTPCSYDTKQYDRVGRVSYEAQYPYYCSAIEAFVFPYTYDLAGNMTSSSDGYFHTYTHTYNTAGRLTAFTSSYSDPTDPPNFLSAVHYNALGLATSDTLGNGETESFSFSNRGKAQSATVSQNGSTHYSFNISSFAPNGNILAASDSANGTWSYSYDQFNRLVGSNKNSGQAVFNYVYDRFGNRWQQMVRTPSSPPSRATIQVTRQTTTVWMAFPTTPLETY